MGSDKDDHHGDDEDQPHQDHHDDLGATHTKSLKK